jgi:hypothetical protein
MLKRSTLEMRPFLLKGGYVLFSAFKAMPDRVRSSRCSSAKQLVQMQSMQ